jgi:AcrR family transcriptional regulator
MTIGRRKGTRAGAHRRNADATRKRILASARRAFSRAGYDGVGVREIAQGAGVTAMMVNRYFGSKERLFAEVVAEAIAAPSILTRENIASPTFGRDIAAALVERTGTGAIPLDGFLIMLNSLSNKRAAKIERALIEAHHEKAITAALTGELAPQRAALVLSLIAGFQVMRQMIGLSTLAEADPKTLVRILRPLFQQLIEGKICESYVGSDRTPMAHVRKTFS